MSATVLIFNVFPTIATVYVFIIFFFFLLYITFSGTKFFDF